MAATVEVIGEVSWSPVKAKEISVKQGYGHTIRSGPHLDNFSVEFGSAGRYPGR